MLPSMQSLSAKVDAAAGDTPARLIPRRREHGAALICRPKFMGVTFGLAIPLKDKSFFDKVEYCRSAPGNRLTVNAHA
jgi:hypothetical protein